MVGKGAFGSVYQGLNQVTGEIIAIKTVKVSLISLFANTFLIVIRRQKQKNKRD
jgi:serine/threonine protein kinase